MTAVWKKAIRLLAIAAAVLPLVSARASTAIRPVDREPDIDRVIHEMERVRRDIEDLVAVVDHAAVSPRTGREEVSRITLTYRSPDQLKTEVAGGREVLINGGRMWIYSPEIEAVEAYLLKNEEQRRAALYEMSWGLTSPIRVLLRGTRRTSERLEDGTFLVTVVPDQAEAEVERIRAWVNPETWLIERMEITPAAAPPAVLTVREWRVNTGLEDDFFEFRLPEGADLFEPLETGGEIIQ